LKILAILFIKKQKNIKWGDRLPPPPPPPPSAYIYMYIIYDGGWSNYYETSSRKDRKDRSTPYNLASSRGQPPLHYINEQFLDDTNENTSFLYIGV